MIRYMLVTATLALAMPASAAQFNASNDVCVENYNCGSDSYTGPGGDYYESGEIGYRGVVDDGGVDAFDGYGLLNDFPGLELTRQTELLPGTNIYRFFDTFTNSTGSTINRTVRFYGNLGSDGDENIQFTNTGSVVTCDAVDCIVTYDEEEDEFGGVNDPVLALVYNNNGFGSGELTGDNFDAYFDLSVASGQSVSLLNFAFLAYDESDRSGDRALAISTAQALQAAPNVSGLSKTQLARVLNFDTVAAVPEPATWGLMIAGFGLVGAAARRRRSVTVAA